MTTDTYVCCDTGPTCTHRYLTPNLLEQLRTIATDPRLACPPDCADCVTHPHHQAEAYRLGHNYGLRYAADDGDAEIAYYDGQIAVADRGAVAYLIGIRDGLTARDTAELVAG